MCLRKRNGTFSGWGMAAEKVEVLLVVSRFDVDRKFKELMGLKLITILSCCHMPVNCRNLIVQKINYSNNFLTSLVSESITRGYNGRTIMICSDSQAALKVLESVTYKSKLVLECLGCLNELATHNSVQLVWVPGHDGILGNERAEELAKKGADTPFIGSEPILGLPHSVVK
jgi:Ribonuclease HI